MAIRPHGKGEVENTTASKGLISLGAFGRMPGAVSRQQATLGFTQQWALLFLQLECFSTMDSSTSLEKGQSRVKETYSTHTLFNSQTQAISNKHTLVGGNIYEYFPDHEPDAFQCQLYC